MWMMSLMGLSVLVPLFMGVPIAVTLGGVGLAWIAFMDPNLLQGAAFSIWNTSTADVLASIPLFLLMGEIIQRSDLAGRFYDATSLWLRRIPGGLLHSNIIACSMFSAVCGSSTATAATIGTAAIPNLERLKYDKSLTLGTIAAGGTLGILIPPSVPLIIYGSMVEESIGRLFVAAIVPGIVLALMFSAYVLVVACLRPGRAPVLDASRATWPLRWRSIVTMSPLFSIVLLILGGIYFGWTTTTEAAALGFAISLVVAAAQRRLTFQMLWQSLVSVVRFTGMLLFVILGAQVFSFAVFTWGFGADIANAISALPYSPTVIILLITIVYLIIGMFVDPISIMVMTIPVVYPVVTSLGYDPIWFGIVLVVLLEMGLITPPVGMNLFAIQAVQPGRIALSEVALGALPFVVLLLLTVALLVAVPELALWLPSLMS